MALPSSGPLRLSQIAAEFGGTPGHSLSEYFGVATGVPAWGTISVSHFYGKSAVSMEQFQIGIVSQGGWQGYATGQFIYPDQGTISPSLYRGRPFFRVAWSGSFGFQFYVYAPAPTPRDYVKHIVIQGGPTLYSSSATTFEPNVNNAGGYWIWNIPQPPGWSHGASRWIQVYY